jgi:hypothetical protein
MQQELKPDQGRCPRDKVIRRLAGWGSAAVAAGTVGAGSLNGTPVLALAILFVGAALAISIIVLASVLAVLSVDHRGETEGFRAPGGSTQDRVWLRR